VSEIILLLHALQEHRTDHTAPTNQTYEFHFASCLLDFCYAILRLM